MFSAATGVTAAVRAEASSNTQADGRRKEFRCMRRIAQQELILLNEF
jgi:hypothetical protein